MRVRRWVRTRETIETRGGKIHTLSLTRGRITKAAETLAEHFAKLALAGKTEEETYDVLVDKYGLEATNDFTSNTRLLSRGAVPGPKDAIAFETFASKSSVPYKVYGDVPQIDWCNPQG